MDIELMRRLSPRVNVIPVVGKADSLTLNELKAFKKRVGNFDWLRIFYSSNSLQIMEDIDHYEIAVYNFPYDVEEDDEDTIEDNASLRVCFSSSVIRSNGLIYTSLQSLLPFAIVGSEEEIPIDGQPTRARIYPWGIVEVDNPKHSDFSRLRSTLLW